MKPRDEKSPARFRSKSTSMLVRTKKIQEIEAAFERARICVIEAPPLSGKTTLIQQTVETLKSKYPSLDVLQLEVRTKMEFSAFLAALSRLVGGGISEVSSADSVIEELNEREIFLVIDNLDFVEGASYFLESALSKIHRASILCSTICLPKLNPLKSIDLRCIRSLALTQGEIQLWLSQLNVKMGSEVGLDEIFSYSKGNISSLRMILSGPLIDSRPLEIGDLRAAYDPAFFEKILARLSPVDLRILKQTVAIECHPTMPSQELEKLSEFAKKSLYGIGLLDESELRTGRLIKEFQAYLKSIVPKIEQSELRLEILAALDGLLDSESEEERIRQCIALGRSKEAATFLNSFVFELGRQMREDAVIELTNDTWRYLSPLGYFARRSALLSRRRKLAFDVHEKINQELEVLVDETKDDDDRANYLQIAGRTAFSAGDNRRAEELVSKALSLASPKSEARLWSEMLKAKLGKLGSIEATFVELIRIRDEIERSPGASPVILAFCNYELSLACWYRSKYAEAIPFGLVARDQLLRAGVPHAGRIVDANILFHRWCAGHVEKIEPDLERALEAAHAVGSVSNVRALVETLCSSLLQRGYRNQAMTIWKTNSHAAFPIRRESSSGIEQFLPYVVLLLREGASIEAQEVIDKIFIANPEARDRGALFLRGLKMILIEPSLKSAPESVAEILLDRSRGTPSDRANLLSALFEQIWLQQRAINLDSYRRLVDSVRSELAPVPEKMIFETYWALIVAMKGIDLEPEMPRLDDVLGFCTKNEIWLGLVRLNLAFGIEALRKSNFMRAHFCFIAARGAGDRIDSCEEIFWSRVLGVYCERRLGISQVSKCELPEESSANEFLSAILNGDVPRYRHFWWNHYISSASEEAKGSIREDLAERKFSYDSKTRVLSINGRTIDLSERGVVCRTLEILFESRGKYLSKEVLVSKIWNESYNPLVHDTRIYTTIRRLRILTSELASTEIIFTRDGTYALIVD